MKCLLLSGAFGISVYFSEVRHQVQLVSNQGYDVIWQDYGGVGGDALLPTFVQMLEDGPDQSCFKWRVQPDISTGDIVGGPVRASVHGLSVEAFVVAASVHVVEALSLLPEVVLDRRLGPSLVGRVVRVKYTGSSMKVGGLCGPADSSTERRSGRPPGSRVSNACSGGPKPRGGITHLKPCSSRRISCSGFAAGGSASGLWSGPVLRRDSPAPRLVSCPASCS